MRRFLSSRWVCAFGPVLGILAISARAQTSSAVQQIATEDGKQGLIPTRAAEFKAVEVDPGFALPAATVDYPHCLSDGSLVLRSIDWDALKKTPKGQFPKYNENVLIVRG